VKILNVKGDAQYHTRLLNRQDEQLALCWRCSDEVSALRLCGKEIQQVAATSPARLGQ